MIIVEIEDGGEDTLVGFIVKPGFVQDFQSQTDGFFIDQHGTQNGFFGVQVLGRDLYFLATHKRILAVTSGCKLMATSNIPNSLIGLSRTIAFLSILCPSTSSALAMSASLTDP